MTHQPSAPRLRLPRLHVIVPDPVLGDPGCRERLVPVLEAGGGRVALQLRARRTSARTLHEVAEWLVRRGAGKRSEAAPETPVVLVNDRLDVAVAAGAGGVHLREDSMSPAEARALTLPSMLLGRSVHSANAVKEFGRQVDYLILGAVYATRSHPGRAPLGSRVLAAAAESSRAPLVAIGGITTRRATSLVRAGAHGVAVASGIWRATDPARAVVRYLDAVGEGIAHRRTARRKDVSICG